MENIDTPNASDANIQWLLYKRMFTSGATSADEELIKAFRAAAKGTKKTIGDSRRGVYQIIG